MGIKNLSKLISEKSPNAIKQVKVQTYFNRVIAIDASMWLYQFLVSIRTNTPSEFFSAQLTNTAGDVTSHLSGIFYRTIRLLENGIKPVFVFDGKPPEIKSGEIKRRTDAKSKAEKKMKEAVERDDVETARKMARRSIRVGQNEVQSTKQLLKLMGVPVVQAPSEAEATCARLCRDGRIYGVASEDMDVLSFGSPRLIRNLMRSANKDDLAVEYDLKEVLKGFGVSMEQFVDICILCGCDYTCSIAGIGPKRAFELILKYGSIEKIKSNCKKYDFVKEFNFEDARKIFYNPEVSDFNKNDFIWKDPDENQLIQFMVEKNGFSIERVKTAIKRIIKSKKKRSQTRIDSFFAEKEKFGPKNIKKTVNFTKVNKIKKKINKRQKK